MRNRVGQSKCLAKYVQILADGGTTKGVDDHDCLAGSIATIGLLFDSRRSGYWEAVCPKISVLLMVFL
jgi:hypothetical protein